MTLTFANRPDLVAHIADQLAAALPEGFVESGSRISASTYFTLSDRDGEQLWCIRVSDHAGRSCSSEVNDQILLGRDLPFDEVEDEDGDFDHYAIDAWRIDDAVAATVALAARKIAA